MNQKLKLSFIWTFLFILSLIFSVNAVITTPYLWYNMENSSFQDELNNINLTDFSSTNVSGVIGSGRDFESGSSQYASKLVTSAMTSENETWTISMWVKPESFAGTGYAGIFLIGNAANFARLGVTVNSAGNILIAGGTGTADTKVNTGVSISTGSWHHLVIVHNSNLTNGTYLYINGTNRANATVPNPTIESDNNVTLSRWIGGGGTTNYYDGSMDLVGYWDTTLTSAEVSELWNSSAGVAYPFSTPTPVLSFTSISLVNNSYFNTTSIQINTSVLNTSTNGNVNQTYYLYYNNGTLINSTQYEFYLNNNCYQESANISNQNGNDGSCNLSYSGSYSTSSNNLSINYTKPLSIYNLSSLWYVKYGSFSKNISISNNCFNLNPIQLRITSNKVSNPGIQAYCYNNTDWEIIAEIVSNATNTETSAGSCNNSFNDGNWSSGCYATSSFFKANIAGGGTFYEEAMIWQINNTNNLNSTINITNLNQNTYKIYFYAKNTETNATTSNYTFTIDTTNPTINNNILSEYNYYNISGFNSSCTDLALLSCNISINSQNKALNTTTFNFTQNGNFSYNITAIDLAGNTATSSGIILINPYQYLRAYDSARLLYVADPYTLGTYSSDINGYITIPLYDLGIGTHTLQFDKSGYVSSNHSFTFNTTSALNTSFNVTPVSIVIRVYDEDAPTTQLYFNLTYISNGNSTIYLNQLNFSKYYNETFDGNLTLIFDSYNYSTRKLYTTLNNNSATSHTVYLKRSSLSTSVIFQTLDLTGTRPIEDVEFVFEKYINGTLIPLAEAKTDSSGYTYFNMGVSEDYKIVITKSGYVTQTINSIPGKTTYTILMEPDNIQQGFVFQDFSYKFLPVIKQQTSLPFSAGVNVVDSDNLLSSWTITVTGDNTSFTQTSINSAGGLVEFNITNASRKYKLNLSGMRDGEYFEFIDYVSFKNQSSQVTTLVTEAENMDNDPDATYDKVMLILFIYVIFVVLGTIVSFGNSTFGAMLGLLPIALFVYLSWLSLGFAILFGVFTILGVLYFQK